MYVLRWTDPTPRLATELDDNNEADERRKVWIITARLFLNFQEKRKTGLKIIICNLQCFIITSGTKKLYFGMGFLYS